MSKCYPCEVGNHDDCRGPDCECSKTEIEHDEPKMAKEE